MKFGNLGFFDFAFRHESHDGFDFADETVFFCRDDICHQIGVGFGTFFEFLPNPQCFEFFGRSNPGVIFCLSLDIEIEFVAFFNRIGQFIERADGDLGIGKF